MHQRFFVFQRYKSSPSLVITIVGDITNNPTSGSFLLAGETTLQGLVPFLLSSKNLE
ncbi:hypothetical protein [Rufibacter psychrotolerans]|uniref:hypothetical protein n=1 Tax=Rufibacter psychrotolerans TaxID=2812556 RepID=UPI0019686F69|nr:hypothetical protein [Rufibacter sp. SYSU D00308]